MWVARAGRWVDVAAALPPADRTWTEEDAARARTVAARLLGSGVKAVKAVPTAALVGMAVWRAKWPGLRFAPEAEAALTAALPPR